MPLKNKEFGFHGSFKPEGNTPHQIQRGKAANALRPHIEKHLKHALEIYTQKLEGTKLGKHYASLKVDSNMVDHFLDSKHGRALASADQEDNFNFHDQLRKSAGEFMSHYKPELHEEAIGDFLDTHHTKAAPYAKKLNKEQLLAAHRMTKSPEHKKIASDEMKSRGISEETILEYEKYTDKNGVTWNDEGDSDKGHTNWGRGPRLKSSQYGPTIKSKFGDHKVRLNKSTGKWEKVQEEVEAEGSITEQTSTSGDRTVTNSHTDKAAAVAIREQLEQAGYDASVVKAGPVYKVVVEGVGRAATLKLIEQLQPIEEAVSDASVQAALDKNPIIREWFKTVGRGSNEPLEIKIVKGVIMITAIDTNDVATMMSDWNVELKSKSLDALLKMLKTDIEHHKTMKKSSFWS